MGEIIVDEKNISKIRNKELPYLRRKIGIIFQDFQLFQDRNAYENIKFIMTSTGWKDNDKIDKKIKELLDQINDLDVQKNALDDEEEINERANLIADELEQQRLLGIRKPSTYSQRAKEFATANEDYLGNDYLKILSAKFLKKQKEAQQKVSKPKDKSDKDYLIKRLKGLQMLAKVNPKDNDLKRRLKGMKMLLKNNYGITRV